MKNHLLESCAVKRRAVQETLEVINGKWKLLILLTLQSQPFNFTGLAKEIGITPRMLSKELQELEAHKMISRTVLKTVPLSVEYSITDYGLTLSNVLEAMKDWGMKHRNKIIHNIDK